MSTHKHAKQHRNRCIIFSKVKTKVETCNKISVKSQHGLTKSKCVSENHLKKRDWKGREFFYYEKHLLGLE